MLEAFSKFLPKLRKPKPHRPIITTSESGVDGTFTCRVVLLDGSTMFLDVKLSEKGQVVLNQVYSKLRLYEKEFFSLKFLENGTQKWLKLSKSINSQLAGSGPHTLFFCVRFYPMGPARIMSDVGRYQIYLQIRKDIQQGKLPLPDDVSPTFAALSLQADVGEVDVMDLDQEDLIVISVFKPHQKTLDEFKASVRQEQKKYEGKSSSRAEFSFLEQASWLDHYGVEMHEVKGEDGSSFELGISPTGLLLFREGKRVGAHYWPRLSKISFRNKMLQLRIIVTTGGEETRSYECSDKESCKSLYKSCIAHHAFFKLVTSTSIHQSQPQNSMRHSSSSSKLFSIGPKTRKDAVIPDVVSGEAYHQPLDYYHNRHQRRLRRNSGSESCPEIERFMSRPSSCAMMPIGRRADYPESPMGQRSYYYAEGSVRRMSPVSMYGGSRRGTYGREDDYVSGSESESLALGQDRRFHRGHPVYMTTVEARRGRSRPLEDASFYSEVEREPRRHHRHCRSRHRVYPDDPHAARQGFGDRYVGPQYGVDFHHVYDRLPADFESGGYPLARETTIRWADENGRRDYERSKYSRSELQSDARKRYRKRSQSPGCGTRPPQELATHFRYVDQLEVGVSDEQLRDIPYTRVETDIAAVPARFSPRTKSRIRMSRRTVTQRRQNSEVVGHVSGIPDGEAPPPYLGAANSPGRRSEASIVARSRRAVLEGMESRDAASVSRSRMQNVDLVESYRRDVNMSLARAPNQEEPSVTDYHDVDGPESREGMDSRSSRQHAYIDTVENYRREMSSRLARSSDPNEATLGWYDQSTHESGEPGRVESRMRNL